MAARKFIKLNNGRLTEESGLVTSDHSPATDGALVALDSTGRIDETMMPIGIGADVASLPASENLSAGDFVNVWNDGGTMKVRKADATAAGKEADGFIKASVTAPANASVYFEGQNTSLTSLTLGARYYLDTTAGGVVSTPPSGSGNVVQYLGRAISATAIAFEGTDGVILE